MMAHFLLAPLWAPARPAALLEACWIDAHDGAQDARSVGRARRRSCSGVAGTSSGVSCSARRAEECPKTLYRAADRVQRSVHGSSGAPLPAALRAAAPPPPTPPRALLPCCRLRSRRAARRAWTFRVCRPWAVCASSTLRWTPPTATWRCCRRWGAACRLLPSLFCAAVRCAGAGEGMLPAACRPPPLLLLPPPLLPPLLLFLLTCMTHPHFLIEGLRR